MARGEVLTLTLAEGVTITEGIEVTPGSGMVVIDDDTNWGAETTEHTYSLAGESIEDGTKAQWSWHKLISAGKYVEIVGAEIEAEETQVTVKGNHGEGTFRLIGMY